MLDVQVLTLGTGVSTGQGILRQIYVTIHGSQIHFKHPSIDGVLQNVAITIRALELENNEISGVTKTR